MATNKYSQTYSERVSQREGARQQAQIDIQNSPEYQAQQQAILNQQYAQQQEQEKQSRIQKEQQVIDELKTNLSGATGSERISIMNAIERHSANITSIREGGVNVGYAQYPYENTAFMPFVVGGRLVDSEKGIYEVTGKPETRTEINYTGVPTATIVQTLSFKGINWKETISPSAKTSINGVAQNKTGYTFSDYVESKYYHAIQPFEKKIAQSNIPTALKTTMPFSITSFVKAGFLSPAMQFGGTAILEKPILEPPQTKIIVRTEDLVGTEYSPTPRIGVEYKPPAVMSQGGVIPETIISTPPRVISYGGIIPKSTLPSTLNFVELKGVSWGALSDMSMKGVGLFTGLGSSFQHRQVQTQVLKQPQSFRQPEVQIFKQPQKQGQLQPQMFRQVQTQVLKQPQSFRQPEVQAFRQPQSFRQPEVQAFRQPEFQTMKFGGGFPIARAGVGGIFKSDLFKTSRKSRKGKKGKRREASFGGISSDWMSLTQSQKEFGSATIPSIKKYGKAFKLETSTKMALATFPTAEILRRKK